ncbi:unnamed protein product [Arabidopsis halleri]
MAARQLRSIVYYSNLDLFTALKASWRDTMCAYMAPDPPTSEDLPEVCGEIMMEYAKEIMNLGELLFELLSEALGLYTDHLKDMDCSKSLVCSASTIHLVLSLTLL